MTEIPDENPAYKPTYKDVIHDIEAKSTVSLDEFDSKRHELLDHLAEMAAMFDEVISKGDEITISSAEIVSESFREFVGNLILEENSISQSLVELIAKVYKGDSDERVKMFNGCIESDDSKIDQFDQEVLIKKFTDIFTSSDTIDEALDSIATFYQADFNNDVAIYVTYLVDKYKMNHPELHDHENEMRVSTLEIKKSPKEHVVDVAKIAAGVLAALAVDRLMHRKK